MRTTNHDLAIDAVATARQKWEALSRFGAEEDAARREGKGGPRHRAAETARAEAARRSHASLAAAFSMVPTTPLGALALMDLFDASDDGLDPVAGAIVRSLATFIRGLAQAETGTAAS